MPCNNCEDQSAILRRARAERQPQVNQAVLEVRYNLCLSCEMHEAGRCALLHGQELAEFIPLTLSRCPLDRPRW